MTFLCMLLVSVAQSSSEDKCNALCTSGFMDDVMCSHNGEYRSMRCSELLTVTRQVAPGVKSGHRQLPCCASKL